ncbi:MAG: glycoside hydrolase family 127 protein, partial [Lachnospiraceae bacterium]|nr:glycoside hydrolase family 127 protein [Lachnospiraceae bacterium]
MLKAMHIGKVHLLPGLFQEREEVNRLYLLELENQGLLQNFYLEAGIVMPDLQVLDDPATAKLHWGWEAPTCQLRGHFLGHWMSAAAMMVATKQDVELKAKLIKVIDELEKCQELNGGQWIGSIPEKFFKKLEKEEYVWSPQYVMHKTLLGLMHAYQLAGIEKALKILDGISD